jgi:hypothetical protein
MVWPIDSCDARGRGRVSIDEVGPTCCRSAPSLQMHRMPPRITQKSCRPRVSDRTMVGPIKPTHLLAKLPEPKASNHHGVMKPSSSNRQLPGLFGIRREPTASPELRFSWMLDASHIRLLSEREGENYFLTSPLIGRIEARRTSLIRSQLRFGSSFHNSVRRLYLKTETWAANRRF